MAEAGCPSEKQAGGPFPGPSRLESGSLVLHTSPCRGLMVSCRLPRQPQVRQSGLALKQPPLDGPRHFWTPRRLGPQLSAYLKEGKDESDSLRIHCQGKPRVCVCRGSFLQMTDVGEPRLPSGLRLATHREGGRSDARTSLLAFSAPRELFSMMRSSSVQSLMAVCAGN